MLARIFEFEIIPDLYSFNFITLTIIGTISTGLLVFDPGSYLIHKYFPYQKYCAKTKHRIIDENIFQPNIIKALNINSIKYEKNKLIGFYYFFISLMFIGVYIINILIMMVEEHFDHSTYVIILIMCLNAYIFVCVRISISFIRKKWTAFQDYVYDCSWYGVVANTDYCFDATLNSFRNSIEQGDWSIVNKLSEKSQNEYVNEEKLKSQREADLSKHIKGLIMAFMKYVGYENIYGKNIPDLNYQIKQFPASKYLLSHIKTDSTQKDFWNTIVELLQIKETTLARKKILKLQNELGKKFADIFINNIITDFPINGFCQWCMDKKMATETQRKEFESMDNSDDIKSLLELD